MLFILDNVVCLLHVLIRFLRGVGVLYDSGANDKIEMYFKNIHEELDKLHKEEENDHT